MVYKDAKTKLNPEKRWRERALRRDLASLKDEKGVEVKGRDKPARALYNLLTSIDVENPDLRLSKINGVRERLRELLRNLEDLEIENDEIALRGGGYKARPKFGEEEAVCANLSTSKAEEEPTSAGDELAEIPRAIEQRLVEDLKRLEEIQWDAYAPHFGAIAADVGRNGPYWHMSATDYGQASFFSLVGRQIYGDNDYTSASDGYSLTREGLKP